MNAVIFLLFFPLVIALALLVVPWKGVRAWIVRAAACIVAAVTLTLLCEPLGSAIRYYDLPGIIGSRAIDLAMLVVEFALAGYIVYMGLRFKKILVCVLAVIQVALILFCEIVYGGSRESGHIFFIDTFSLIMALIVGVVGSLIIMFATGYMEGFHAHFHKKLKDQRRIFFPVLFIFLAAMFGIIFSNKLAWIL
ncbi:MAG: NADH-quinone oxidoreductase subunit L, partial [Candidatus Omnitrophota bacterium]